MRVLRWIQGSGPLLLLRLTECFVFYTSLAHTGRDVRAVLTIPSFSSTDASAIPAPISGNIQATVQAVAYRAADFILKNANSNE
jgi:hypothetical protein